MYQDFQRARQTRESLWHRRRKTIITVFILIIVGLVALLVLRARHQPAKPAVNNTTPTVVKSPPKADPDISMLLTGDWIAHDSLNAAAKKADGSYDYLPLVKAYQPLFKQTDIKFCNDSILNGGQALGISGYPKFNSPTEFVTSMGQLGCNLVNTASNHSFDFTQANIDASVDAWASVPNMLAVAGENKTQAEHDQIHYFSEKGVKFAFLAYTAYSNTTPQNSYGVNVYSQAVAAAQIKEARTNGAQIVIVSMRWGVEYSPTISAAQTTAAQFLADQGANLVLGHGPHVLQPVQELTGTSGNKTLVWYSLGNFVNTQEPPETLFNGVAFLKIDPKTLAITTTGFVPFYMHFEWTPAQAKADDTNARTAVQMYLLENTTQQMINAQQLTTTVEAQKQRLTTTLNARGQNIPLLTSTQILK
ncbi:MAG: CapA family protein [Candidatus Saccharibacteria bacterium]|nr:CapA family protein [Candidatus Saccharibacteria bacterium]